MDAPIQPEWAHDPSHRDLAGFIHESVTDATENSVISVISQRKGAQLRSLRIPRLHNLYRVHTWPLIGRAGL